MRTMWTRAVAAGVIAMCLSAACVASDQWTAPTQEELKMTEQKEVPGAPAVYLFREETSEDALNMWSVYVRLKVLTDAGKEFGNVRLQTRQDVSGFGFQVTDIAGRTIQPDGTVVPFTGKPYEKVVENSKEGKTKSKVFSMPAVQVGSILEYRYKVRFEEHFFVAPTWYPQQDLYVRKAHYMWRPTSAQLTSTENGHETLSDSIAWSPVLPPGAAVKSVQLPGGQFTYELTISDVKPQPEERSMPPLDNYSYRVYFYYTSFHTAEEYWRTEGKFWSKQMDKFIGPGSGVRTFVSQTISPSDGEEVKLQKLYAAVMKLENTSYTRTRTTAEQKKEFKNTDDVLATQRGTDDQIAMLFIAMARAAGFKAYAMSLTNRENKVFMNSYLTFGQLDDTIAIVNVGGKERYFDPGRRYTPFGHLDWRHTLTSGVRQSDAGSVIANTNLEPYSFSNVQRVGDLQLDETGLAKGSVKISYLGYPASGLRQHALSTDETELKDELRKELESDLPGGAEVVVDKIENLADYEKPLVVTYNVKGPLAKATSTRLIVPADVFFVNEKPVFTAERRETVVFFRYPEMMQDAVRVKYPASYTVESAPPVLNEIYDKRLALAMKSKPGPNSITVYRDFIKGDFIFTPKEYPQFRAYYNKLQDANTAQVVLKAAANTSSAAPGTVSVTQ